MLDCAPAYPCDRFEITSGDSSPYASNPITYLHRLIPFSLIPACFRRLSSFSLVLRNFVSQKKKKTAGLRVFQRRHIGVRARRALGARPRTARRHAASRPAAQPHFLQRRDFGLRQGRQLGPGALAPGGNANGGPRAQRDQLFCGDERVRQRGAMGKSARFAPRNASPGENRRSLEIPMISIRS